MISPTQFFPRAPPDTLLIFNVTSIYLPDSWLRCRSCPSEMSRFRCINRFHAFSCSFTKERIAYRTTGQVEIIPCLLSMLATDLKPPIPSHRHCAESIRAIKTTIRTKPNGKRHHSNELNLLEDLILKSFKVSFEKKKTCFTMHS